MVDFKEIRKRIEIFLRLHRPSDFQIVVAVSLIVSVALLFYGIENYRNTPYMYTFTFLAVFSFILPVGVAIYLRYARLQEKERYFPQFLKDLADGVRAGLSLPEAVVNVSKINYGALSQDVKRLATLISWGVPFDEAIRRFAMRTGSKMIKASVELILQAYTAGGALADTLDTVAEDAGKMYSLREDRKARFSGFISTIYSVYIIFLIITAVMATVLIPEIPSMPSVGFGSLFGGAGPQGLNQPISEGDLDTIFFNLALIEAIFAGLFAGVVGEGSFAAGIKHAIILSFIGIVAFQLFIPPPNPADRIARAIVKTPPTFNATIHLGKFFIDKNITVTVVADYARAHARSMSIQLPETNLAPLIHFAVSPNGCTVCGKDLNVVDKGIYVIHPAYANLSVSVTGGQYYVYVGSPK